MMTKIFVLHKVSAKEVKMDRTDRTEGADKSLPKVVKEVRCHDH